MNPKALRYLIDIESVITEIEQIMDLLDKDFDNFRQDTRSKQAIEHDLEIIGEAVNRLQHLEPELSLTYQIQPMAFDADHMPFQSPGSMESERIWGMVQTEIPKLKDEIGALMV